MPSLRNKKLNLFLPLDTQNGEGGAPKTLRSSKRPICLGELAKSFGADTNYISPAYSRMLH